MIAIKNNEDKVLKLPECLNLLDNFRTSEKEPDEGRFDVRMFAALERQMLMVLKFRINPPTPLDFALMLAHRVFEAWAAQSLVVQSLPVMYCVLNDYNLSRHRTPEVIGLASMLHFLRGDVHDVGVLEQLNTSILVGLDPLLIREAFELNDAFIST